MKNWPEGERPREKLARFGSGVLSDAELLALLIETGDARTGLSAVDCARRLLRDQGDLRMLSTVSARGLRACPGVGPGKAARIQAAFELARRIASRRRERGAEFRRSEDVFRNYVLRLRDERQERFLVILLDSKSRCLGEKTISLGSLNQSVVHPREVFRPAVREAAASVIFVHNHPSGDPEPSREDVQLTERLARTGKLLGIRVMDHVIVGESNYYSFFDQGLLTA